MDQTILACDDNGKFLEYIPKEVGHTRAGRRHLAITVLLYNSKGEVLLQKRKHKVFDNIWDFTASTHPLHKNDGSDETLEEATLRALKDEYGIEKIKVEKIGSFNYFAKINPDSIGVNGLCENEHDTLLIGEYDGEIKLDPSVGYEYKWVKKEGLLKAMESNPKNYTPWANQALKVLKKTSFFG